MHSAREAFSMATNEYMGNGKEKAEFHCKGKVLCLPLCELRPGSTSHRVPPVSEVPR